MKKPTQAIKRDRCQRKVCCINTFFYVCSFFFSFGIAGYALVLPLLDFSGPIHSRLFELSGGFFYMHTMGGALALILAPFQLLQTKQNRRHKIKGYIYVLAVSISAIGGLYIAQGAYGGMSSTIALSLLAILWLMSTYVGVYKAIAKKREAHRRWMIRSTALTFAAITLRLLSPVLYEFYSLYDAQQIIYWSCWTINLFVAELYLARHQNLTVNANKRFISR